MTTPCLKVEGLRKVYHLYRSSGHRFGSALFPFLVSPPQVKNALNGVSLTAHKGEVLGIVGANGSGKSTLLKCIAGRIEPTEGVVSVNGRLAPIIELGAGFNQEATGVENIFNFGAVLGMTDVEIRAKLNEIVNFAELGPYVRQPVRTYSSGMKARLAFSVASHVDADVIVLDEVLAVGDRAFRAKCSRAIGRLVGSGACVILVSHDTDTIINLCTRAVEINEGRIIADGEPREVVRAYEKRILGGLDHGGHGEKAPAAKPDSETRYSEEIAKIDLGVRYRYRDCSIIDARFLNRQGERINLVETGEEIEFVYTAIFGERLQNATFGMQVRDADGVLVSGAGTHMVNSRLVWTEQNARYDVRWNVKVNLSPGLYFFTCGVQFDEGEGREFAARWVDAIAIRVAECPTRRSIGIADLEQVAIIRRIQEM